jgi:ABC-2 type transport system ATP-binding protein
LHQQIYRIEADVFQNTLDELTDLLDLRDLLQQPVRELSLGERMKMELTAALLHSPEVLFLDEPTIGLDVVAQHNIQQFLKYYQQKRKITILLTSHYMKDVAALCKRVVIIADGLIKYDGSLDGIIESTDQRKLITLQFRDAINDSLLAALKKFGDVTDVETPRIKLTVARDVVPRMLSSILDGYQVDDVVVEDPPLEDVIAAVFSEVTAGRVHQIDDDKFESIGDGKGL